MDEHRRERAAEKELLAQQKRERAREKEELRQFKGRSNEARRALLREKAKVLETATIRSRYFTEAALHVSHLGVSGPAGRFIVDTTDDGISRRLFVHGSYASNTIREVRAVLERLGRPLPRGGAIVDIGANIGPVAIAAVVEHGFERAIAAELHPPNRRLLRVNVLLNDLEDRIQVIGGLSDRDGEARLVRAVGVSGLATLGEPVDGVPAEPLALSRLDTLVDRGEVSVDDATLVWLDVQGHEPQALEGARCLIDRHVPVMMELSPEHLRQQSNLERLEVLVRNAFAGFVEMRGVDVAAPKVHESGALPAFVAALGDGCTDILLLPGD